MSVGWYLARRTGFAVLAAYLVLSLTFVFIAVPADPNIAVIEYNLHRHGVGQQKTQQIVQKYKDSRNLDEPLSQRYVDWLVGVTTLDWGYSYSQQAPVSSVLRTRLGYTLGYVLPSILLSVVGGLLFGIYSALRSDTLLERFGSGLTYLGFGVPNFWLANLLLLLAATQLRNVFGTVGHGSPTLTTFGFATLVLTTGLLGGQARYTQSEIGEYLGTSVIKLVRAKGAGPGRIARHTLRLAAFPLIALFFTEMLSIVVLNIYVIETVFDIPGLGSVTLSAINDHDVPLVIGSTMLLVLFGIGGNLLQDIAFTLFDPRAEP